MNRSVQANRGGERRFNPDRKPGHAPVPVWVPVLAPAKQPRPGPSGREKIRQVLADPRPGGGEVQLRFRLPLELDPETAVTVSGYIDRVDRLPGGAVEVIDYKSGNGDPVRAATSPAPSSARKCRDTAPKVMSGIAWWIVPALRSSLQMSRRMARRRGDAAASIAASMLMAII